MVDGAGVTLRRFVAQVAGERDGVLFAVDRDHERVAEPRGAVLEAVVVEPLVVDARRPGVEFVALVAVVFGQRPSTEDVEVAALVIDRNRGVRVDFRVAGVVRGREAIEGADGQAYRGRD
ncbi:hypothetical protein BRD07_01990 [Halobacteriales archaeon QS_9_68_42]|nr:MAG: hypothetical protein BRD07_01990 [Halobacteriales archaeon QS_9_68_42]